MHILTGYEDGVLRVFSVETEADSNVGSGNFFKLTRALSVKWVKKIFNFEYVFN